MILRKYFKSNDYRVIFGIGQLCLSASILGLLVSNSHILSLITTNISWLNFTEGFCWGLSFSILILSALFNVRGLILLKQHRKGEIIHG